MRIRSAVGRSTTVVAATGAVAPWLDRTRHEISAKRRARDLVTTSYRFDRMTAVLVRGNPQDAPRIAIDMRGEVHRSVSTSSSGARTTASDSSFHQTFALELVGAHYLIADQRAVAEHRPVFTRRLRRRRVKI